MCTHAQYGVYNTVQNCYTANNCPASTGVPTFYGSVENEAGARVKFQKEGGCPNLLPLNRCELDEIPLTGIASIQDGAIRYCKNDFLSDGNADGDANEQSQNVFNLDSEVLTLNAEVDMKQMGGPRHLISLVTADAGCIVHARIMILPKTSANAGLNLAVSDMKVLDEMYAPGLSYFQDTGVKLEFLVTFYDNIDCAIDFYEDLGDISAKQDPLMRFGDITVSVDGTRAGSAQQSWIECVSSHCWPVARRDKMSELDNNNGVSWGPGDGCQVKVQFDQFNGELAAIAYQDQDKVTYNFGLNEADSIGYKSSKYNGQTSILNALDADNRVSISGASEDVQLDVQDIDNMPPLFCDGTDAQANCPAESYHRSAYKQY